MVVPFHVCTRRFAFLCATVGIFLLARLLAIAQPVLIYETGFEAREGFDTRFTLVGQRDWVGTVRPDCLGNGLIGDASGQSAYVGAFPVCGGAGGLAVWRPLNFFPLASNLPVVNFSVSMVIVDSTNRFFDCFRWSVYDVATNRLLTIDFDNNDLSINCQLHESASFNFTGYTFTNDQVLELDATLDFAANRWGARLNGAVLTNNAPLTMRGLPSSLGHISGTWVYRGLLPGNNFMIFDNYKVTAEARPRVSMVGNVGTQATIRVQGQPGQRYAVERSTDLRRWTALRTNSAPSGFFDFADGVGAGASARFYRARRVEQ